MRFGIVTAWAEEDWHSQRLLDAFARRGEAVAIDPATIGAAVAPGGFAARAGLEDLGSLDALVLARGLGRGGDPDVQFEIYRALAESGVVVANGIDALLAAQDKLRTSWLLRRAGLPTPDVMVAQTRRGALAALAEMRDAVVKPIAGSLGEDVARVTWDRAGRRDVVERVERHGAVYLQRFLPNPGRDVRLFVVGDMFEAAIERVAPPGQWVANVACGGRVRPLPRNAGLEALAVAAANALQLDWAGVDVVVGPDGASVIEVNGNPSWAAVHDVTGRDMAEPIAEHVLARALRRRNRDTSVCGDVRASHG